MTRLEQATIEYFRAVLEEGVGVLGHDKFVIRLDVHLGAAPDDQSRIVRVHDKVQAALATAAETITAEATKARAN